MFGFLTGLVFYVFAVVLVASAALVVTTRNPVHGVLFLIMAFFNAAALFLLMGAEFVAMILLIVYVGAVAVLFLFVVMMLDIDTTQFRTNLRRYVPLGLVLGIVLLAELVLLATHWTAAPGAETFLAAPMESVAWGPQTNTHALGRLIYTQYIYLFQAAGLVLLVAMIGAIVLTLRHRSGVRRQHPGLQAAREPRDAVALRQVKTGEGIP